MYYTLPGSSCSGWSWIMELGVRFLPSSIDNLAATDMCICMWGENFGLKHLPHFFPVPHDSKNKTLRNSLLVSYIIFCPDAFARATTHFYDSQPWHRVPKEHLKAALFSAIVSLTSRAITSSLRRRHLFHCFGQTVQLVRGILLDGTGLPMLQMAYLTVNDSENDNMPPNGEEVISVC